MISFHTFINFSLHQACELVTDAEELLQAMSENTSNIKL